MNEFTIRIEAPELAKAITNLAIALCATIENNETEKSGAYEKSSAPEKTSSQIPVSTPQKPSEAEEQPRPNHTIEEVRAAFSEYARSKGKDKAKQLLSKYGAAKVTELKADCYDAAIRDIREG